MTMHGMGPFLASRDMVSDPREVRKKLLECAATWCPILVESLDGRRQRQDRIADLVVELRSHEIDPYLYTFPDPRRAKAAADHLLEVADFVRIDRAHCCLDIEPASDADWSERAVADLFAAVSGVGAQVPSITLFTRTEWDRYAWDAIAPGAEILLQVYERAADPGRLARAIARWPGRRVVPLFGSYLGGLDRLARDMANVSPHAAKVGAAGLWALATSDREERKAIGAWAIETWKPPSSRAA